MKLIRNVTLNKPSCGASLSAAVEAVSSLTGNEMLELAAQLRKKYPNRFVP